MSRFPAFHAALTAGRLAGCSRRRTAGGVDPDADAPADSVHPFLTLRVRVEDRSARHVPPVRDGGLAARSAVVARLAFSASFLACCERLQSPPDRHFGAKLALVEQSQQLERAGASRRHDPAL